METPKLGSEQKLPVWCKWVAQSAVANIPRGWEALWPDATISPLQLCGCAHSITAMDHGSWVTI